MDSTKCKLKSCPNRCGWCYILDQIHLIVMPFQMKVWSIAINDATGSLEVPPEVLVKSFKPARDTQANPMRDNGQKSSFSSNSVTTSTPAPSVAPMQYPVHQMMPQPYLQTYSTLSSTLSLSLQPSCALHTGQRRTFSSPRCSKFVSHFWLGWRRKTCQIHRLASSEEPYSCHVIV